MSFNDKILLFFFLFHIFHLFMISLQAVLEEYVSVSPVCCKRH